ncbi:MAG: hypothetical protein Greene041619_430 [Candidatus Peregrinibacteria bacterium Greene0416_19]|nr:MAG: hypothetical protein Greene041619_430 [Candidatus Peregrinibacteria bacterium Greene0416_19]
MTTLSSTAELRNMQVADLERDVRAGRALVRKLRIGIEMNKEKDSARYRREKRQLARMLTILGQKRRKALPRTAKNDRVPAPVSHS